MCVCVYVCVRARARPRACVYNQVSSRSHSVLTLKVSMKHKKNKETRRGVLNLIDLAGSEKVHLSTSSTNVYIRVHKCTY